jgi:competence protein ComEA
VAAERPAEAAPPFLPPTGDDVSQPIDWRSIDEPAPARANGEGGVDRRLLLAGAAGVVALAVAAGAFLVLSTPQPSLVVEAAGSPPGSPAPSGTAAASEIWIDVSGAVKRPGLYRLETGSRVGDAIRTAGGFAPTVDATAADRQLNLAAVLPDGTKVHVPARGEATPPPATAGGAETGGGGGPAAGAGGGLVNLNTATAGELEALPGIGEVTAAEIIAAREQEPFASIDELRSREIVGEATFEKIRDLVVAGP